MVVKTNQKESLKDLILIKREKSSIYFDEHFLNSFYKDDLTNLALKSGNFNKFLNSKDMNLFFGAAATIPFIIFFSLSNPLTTLFIPVSLTIGFTGNTKWFKNKMANKWVSNKNNIEELKKIYFEQTVADKNILKEFALKYSEETLVNLLEEKEVIKYEDIINFMSVEEGRKLKTEKRENLIKAVKCMTNE